MIEDTYQHKTLISGDREYWPQHAYWWQNIMKQSCIQQESKLKHDRAMYFPNVLYMDMILRDKFVFWCEQ